VRAVNDHYRSQGQTHDEKSERLQTIQVTHEVPPGRNKELTAVTGTAKARKRWLQKISKDWGREAEELEDHCARGESLLPFFRQGSGCWRSRYGVAHIFHLKGQKLLGICRVRFSVGNTAKKT
jgi:hypothetical protein